MKIRLTSVRRLLLLDAVNEGAIILDTCAENFPEIGQGCCKLPRNQINLRRRMPAVRDASIE